MAQYLKLYELVQTAGWGYMKLQETGQRLLSAKTPAEVIEILRIVPTVLGEGPGIDIALGKIGIGGDTILIYRSDGSPVAEFARTALVAANAAAASGDIILLPAGTIAGNITIASGVEVTGVGIGNTILSGKITMAAGGILSNLSVIRTANDANDLIGVESAAECYLYNCNITCIQSGAGHAIAVKAIAGGNISILDSWLNGQSTGGNGHSIFSSGGDIHVYGGIMEYSTTAAEAPVIVLYDFISTKGLWYFTPEYGPETGDWIPGIPGVLRIYGPHTNWNGGFWRLDGQGTIAHTGATYKINGTFDPTLNISEARVTFTDTTYQQINLVTGINTLTITAGNDGKTVSQFYVHGNKYGTSIGNIYDDIWISGFTLPAGDMEVHAVQMDAVTGTPIAGDRAAWDATSYGSLHAKDIADVALQRHLTAPGVAGKIDVSDGANWVEGDLPDISGLLQDTQVDWGTGAGQVSAVDVPIADAGAYYTGTEVEAALQEIGYNIDRVLLGLQQEGLSTGCALTIPAGYQILVYEVYDCQGDMTIEGNLVIL